MASWYPDRSAYFARLDPGRPMFQGDIFRGVPTVFVDHPASHEAAFAGRPPPTPQEAERALTAHGIRGVTHVRGGRAMVLPHPCDFSAAEKGAAHDARVVAQVRRISDSRMGPKPVAAGRVHHTVWVPDADSTELQDDWFVDLRTTTTVDQAYLNPERRVAALSGPAWIALMRRVAFFYTRSAPDLPALVLQEAHQHPDYGPD